MNTALVGLIGIYAVGVGLHGNAGAAWSAIAQDAQGFVPWLLAVVVLRVAYNSSTLRPLVGPFVGLAVLVYILRYYALFAQQINEIAGSQLIPAGAKS